MAKRKSGPEEMEMPPGYRAADAEFLEEAGGPIRNPGFQDTMGFEWVAGMTEIFHKEMDAAFSEGGPGLTPDRASYWQLRILLTIAQQLAVRSK